MKTLTCTTLYAAMLLTGCAATAPEDYNASGPSGSLVRQEMGVGSNVCHYDTGLTIYMQGICPPTIRSSVFRRQ